MNISGVMHNFTEEQLREAIKNTDSVISNLAINLDCDWHTARRYLDKFPEVKTEFVRESEKTSDKAKRNISKAIDEGDLNLSKWYLEKNINTNNEFSDKIQLEHSGDIKVNININEI